MSMRESSTSAACLVLFDGPARRPARASGPVGRTGGRPGGHLDRARRAPAGSPGWSAWTGRRPTVSRRLAGRHRAAVLVQERGDPRSSSSSGPAAGEEPAQAEVLRPVVQHRLGRRAVASGPADLLVVGVRATRAARCAATYRTFGLSMPMPNAEVATTTSSSSSANRVVHPLAFGRLHPAVVRLGVHARRRSAPRRTPRRRGGSRRRPGRARRGRPRPRRAPGAWSASSDEAADLQRDVGPVEAPDDLAGVAQAERPTMSSRTGGEAVAVSAITGGCPRRSMTWPSCR